MTAPSQPSSQNAPPVNIAAALDPTVVYGGLSDSAKHFTTHENVVAVLDAVARLVPAQVLGQSAPGKHSASAADPSSAGWLAALSSAIHVMRAAGRAHEVDKLTEILEHHGNPATQKAAHVTVVVEVDNGVINCARSDGQANVIILDADTEGAEDENVFKVLGQQWNVTQFSLNYRALEGQNGIATDYVRGVVADLDAAPAPPMYLTGTWEHIFVGTQSSNVRLVFDLASNKIIAMQHVSGRGIFALATVEEMADVEDSILNANPEALSKPEDFGLTAVATLPEWACGISDNPCIQQFIGQMAFARTQFGLLVSDLVRELQQHPDQDQVWLLEFAILGEVREYLAELVGKDAGPNPDDKYATLHDLDAWVNQQLKGLEAALVAHITLKSADETMERVHSVTRPGDVDTAPAP